MLYQMHEMQHAAVAPMRLMAEAMQTLYTNPFVPVAYTRLGRTIAANAELFERTTRRYAKPTFDLPKTVKDGIEVAVHEEVVYRKPFCSVLHFRRDVQHDDPKLLIVAPLSGHWATLLRGTVEALLPDHDVYITDWHDARDVSLLDGRFDLDDYIDYIIDFARVLGPNVHLLGVCQPSVPVLAACSVMAAKDDPYQPLSMTLMGGPIDTRANPTQVNDLATAKPIEWFEKNVVHSVPLMYRGRGRRVYPGFLQLTGFMTMNLDRHVDAHTKLWRHLIQNDGDSATQHRTFYDEYLSVMDLPAEYYLQTIKTVFQDHALPEGTMTHRGELVTPWAIRKTALLTVEGEKDDITGIGQTQAAHTICTGIPDSMRQHHMQPKVGHYGVFNGRRWREEVMPHVRSFIRANDKRVLAPQNAERDELHGMGSVVRRLREMLPA